MMWLPTRLFLAAAFAVGAVMAGIFVVTDHVFIILTRTLMATATLRLTLMATLRLTLIAALRLRLVTVMSKSC